MNYYDVKTHVCNSDLNEFRVASKAADPIPGIQGNYDFGSLAHAAVSEQHRIVGNTLDVESGGIVTFEAHRIETAKRMAAAYHERKDLKLIFEGAKVEHAFFRENFVVECDGMRITMRVKCKLDLFRRGIIGGDLKTTVCTNETGFVASLSHFNIDQQGAWYMDIAQLDRFMIIGLSKTVKRGRHQVFTWMIQRGDDMYNSGKAKYQQLAIKHHFLIQNFTL